MKVFFAHCIPMKTNFGAFWLDNNYAIITSNDLINFVSFWPEQEPAKRFGWGRGEKTVAGIITRTICWRYKNFSMRKKEW